MTILNYQNLLINGEVIKYDGTVKTIDGSITRVANPQINGELIYTSDLSTNRSQITIPIRVSKDSNSQFDKFYANGSNNTIVFGDKSYTNCTMEVIPEREDQGVAEYVFFGNPLL